MRSLILALATVSALGLVACTSTHADDVTQAHNVHWRDKVNIPSHMASALPLESAMVDRRDGLLQVQVVVHNRTSSGKTYRARYEWLDEDGRKIDSATEAWKRYTHPGTTREYITGTAPTPLASDWRLTILDWQN